MMIHRLAAVPLAVLTLAAVGCCAKAPQLSEPGFVELFDGKTLTGWEGDETWFRVQDGAIVAGSLEKDVTSTVFLNTTGAYYNFELTYELKLLGSREKGNGGVQIRSERITDNPTRVSGYQVDAGQIYWGRLYDEGRRRQLLTELPEGFSIDEDVNHGQWNRYRVLVKDNTIQVWLNGTMVGNYTEADAEIAKKTGFIAVQAHAGPPSEIWYRNIRIRELD